MRYYLWNVKTYFENEFTQNDKCDTVSIKNYHLFIEPREDYIFAGRVRKLLKVRKYFQKLIDFP